MKFQMKMLVVGLMLFALVAGCAKKPEQEITAAKAAVDAVAAEGGDKYAVEEFKALNDTLSSALAMIEEQDKKIFKNFDEAKAKLATVTTDAAALKTEVQARREAAKTAAMEGLTAATTALEDAKKALSRAPRGKDTAADIEAMKADIAGLEITLAEIQPLIDAGEYLDAKSKADIIIAKAQEITTQVDEAMAKMKAAKKGKKK